MGVWQPSEAVISDHDGLSKLTYDDAAHTGFQRLTTSTASAPTADNDGVDTAVYGNTFKVGDLWENTATGAIYHCKDNSTGAAVWEALAPTSSIPRIDGWVDGSSLFTYVSATSFTVTDNGSNQAIFISGRGLRYKSPGGDWRYGIVRSYTAGTVVMMGGTMGATADTLEWDGVGKIVCETITIPGRWADAASTKLLEEDLNMSGGLPWGHGPCVFVGIQAISLVDDTSGTQPKINTTANGTDILSSDMSVVDTGWTNSGAALDLSNVDLGGDTFLEVTTDGGGTNLDSTDLTVQVVAIKNPNVLSSGGILTP